MYLKKYEEAKGLYRNAIAMLKEILGDEHLAIATLSTRLGFILEIEESYEEAVQLYVDALEVNQKIFGTSHDQVLKMVWRIQRIFSKLNNFDISSDQFENENLKLNIDKILQLYKNHSITNDTMIKSTSGFVTENPMDLFMTAVSLSGDMLTNRPQVKTNEDMTRRKLFPMHEASIKSMETQNIALLNKNHPMTTTQTVMVTEQGPHHHHNHSKSFIIIFKY